MVEQVRRQIDNPSPDWPLVFAAIESTLLVIAGGEASPVSARHVEELARSVADGRVVTVETGHFVHACDPHAFVHHLQAFLDS